MNIRIRDHKLLGALLFAACLLFSFGAEAHGHGGGWGHHGGGWGHHGGGWGHHGGGWGHHGGGWYGSGVYIGGPYISRCGWVPGHWRNGYWIRTHRVCW